MEPCMERGNSGALEKATSHLVHENELTKARIDGWKIKEPCKRHLPSLSPSLPILSQSNPSLSLFIHPIFLLSLSLSLAKRLFPTFVGCLSIQSEWWRMPPRLPSLASDSDPSPCPWRTLAKKNHCWRALPISAAVDQQPLQRNSQRMNLNSSEKTSRRNKLMESNFSAILSSWWVRQRRCSSIHLR